MYQIWYLGCWFQCFDIAFWWIDREMERFKTFAEVRDLEKGIYLIRDTSMRKIREYFTEPNTRKTTLVPNSVWVPLNHIGYGPHIQWCACVSLESCPRWWKTLFWICFPKFQHSLVLKKKNIELENIERGMLNACWRQHEQSVPGRYKVL